MRMPRIVARSGAAHTVRASSVVENLNSRLRSYFFLRRHLGPDYLTLLQFFLNHRRFPRSRHAERVHHSPAELLTGQAHPHWLAMLGYTPFALKLPQAIAGTVSVPLLYGIVRRGFFASSPSGAAASKPMNARIASGSKRMKSHAASNPAPGPSERAAYV